MAFFRSENNVFCDSVKAEVKAGETKEGIGPSKNFRAPQQPYKLDGFSAKFAGAASGTIGVHAVKAGKELSVVSYELSSNESFIATGIGLWLTAGDSVKVVNSANQDASVVVDFSY